MIKSELINGDRYKAKYKEKSCTYGYMEVVCSILGPTLTSQPCSHAFWVLTSLRLP